MTGFFASIAILASLSALPSHRAHAWAKALAPPCLSDYRVAQRPVAHGLGAPMLRRLGNLARQGAVREAWAELTRAQDAYAAGAIEVLGPPRTSMGQLLYRAVQTHWDRTVGPEIRASCFERVAHRHLLQYLEILAGGHWPDSDQILNSYLAAVRAETLPDIVVFDAAWDDSGIGGIQSWQSVLKLDPRRTVRPSRVCTSTSSASAFSTVVLDLADLAFR